MHKNSLELIF